MKYEILIELPEEKVENLFILACEGGSNYWCKSLTPKGKRRGADSYKDMVKNGYSLVDSTTGKTHEVTRADILKGLELMAKEAPSHFSDAFMTGNDDVETGDVFLQLCTFKELIYG